MKSHGRKLLAAFAALALLSTINRQLSTAWAQGTAFTYQGQLQNNGALANGNFDLKFTLFKTNINGTAVAGPVTNSDVGISNGLFTVTIDFGGAVWNGETNWLEIAVETNGGSPFTKLSPRQQVTPTPYAITAENLGSGGLSGTYGGMVTLNNSSNQFTGAFTGDGSNLTNVNAATLGGLNASNFWQLGGNTPASGSQIVGTLNSQSFDLYAGGVRAMRLVLRTDASGQYSNAPNVIGGSSVNVVKASVVGATVGGGGGMDTNGISYPNQVNADFGTISGGLSNSVSSLATYGYVGGGYQNSAVSFASTVGGGKLNYSSFDYTTVAGGFNNTAGGFSNGGSTVAGGANNSATGDYSAVGGGYSNSVGGVGSFIGGGGYDGTVAAGNFVNANAATIGGGLGNQIPSGSRYAFIGGGASNSASAYFAAVVAGSSNAASAQGAFVGGGGADGVHAPGSLSPNGNRADAGGAVVTGGWGNEAFGLDSTVGGGYENRAGGEYSTVAGGYNNYATGAGSFAAGNNANAGYDGSFAWSDGSAYTTATASDQFVARASGGFFFYTGTGSGGATLAAGTTSWTALSDRNAKKNFQSVDTVAVLNKLAGIPIEQWNYKWEGDTDTPNIGPMAQDFKAAFYPGRDDKGISTLEFDGVELAAIQGLNEKLEAGGQKAEARIQKLEAENAELKEENDSLEKRLGALEQIVLKQKTN
jgi:hypothetical protein